MLNGKYRGKCAYSTKECQTPPLHIVLFIIILCKSCYTKQYLKTFHRQIKIFLI